MLPLLLITRYTLILIPAIASMYLESYASNGTYVFFILLFFWVAELRRTIFKRAVWMLLIEIAFSGWLSYTFDGLLFMIFYSTMLTYLHSFHRHLRISFLGVQLIALNLSLQGQSSSSYVLANLLFFILALLLLHMNQVEQNKVDIELLYDQLRRQHYELDEARMQLLDYAKQVENIAQLDERNRISRDIHDDLGHQLIRLKMMMEAGLRILPTQMDKGMEMLTSVRDQLTESMELLRSTVRKLKPDDDSMQSFTLNRLIEGLTKDKSIAIEVDIQGMPYVLYPSLAFILYRNAQEAITNAIRHGGATSVQIQLIYETKQITMSVSNNGRLPAVQTVKGLGMTGMEERSKLIGGQLYVAMDSVFTVTTVLPTFR
ncbi:sensor histidine kinase [Paenibacillus sp. CGMCC 1.16610]|uniref:histidine kinase n=1 Tax=Paenibacillus anseongense TaxID=2682845 RepID=A0ABW9UCD9_9BACL|nr:MULTISPECIES: sensor histidine kinase [Paenibacillus]MBA2937993.1 sensor histidine kinase [Paenibacillus sp. CGMCC 1.16610]MVQ37051.1 sensor histidine kinase [Paenibacillus anseongense]